MSDRHAHGRHRTNPRPTAEPHGPGRRQVLTLGGLAVLAAATKTTLGSSLALGAPTAARWPGYKPGHIYLGASSMDITATLASTGPVGLHRTYYSWGGGSGETRNVTADHAALRLPWVSFKPPSTAPGGWAAVASGGYDEDIRARAQRYAGYAQPVIVTFNHEPNNDATGTPAEFAAAWTHIHDVMADETNLKNVIDVPIIGDWTFNPVNKQGDPEGFLTEAVLDRCSFLGIDLYQNKSAQGYDVRLGRILSWLDTGGHSDKMVGLGETGCTNDFGTPSGATWWSASWAWAAAHADRVAAISYFDSSRNNNNGHNWLLTESADKIAAFKASLTSPTACHL